MGIHVFTNRTLRERDREKDKCITDLENLNIGLEAQVRRLTEQNTRLVAELDRLELTWKTNYDLVLAQREEARHDAAEWDAANVRLQERLDAIRLTLAELLPFLRSLKRGNFRSDRGNIGKYEELREYIRRYDKAVDSNE